MSSATALTDCVLLNVDKTALLREMALQPKLSAMFTKFLPKWNVRYQDDLVDQLFNSSEKRLARVLLLMTHFGMEGASEMEIPGLSQAKPICARRECQRKARGHRVPKRQRPAILGA